jgi:hypothetical protein
MLRYKQLLMASQTFGSALKNILRDPAWAGVRVLVAIVAIVVSVFVVWYFRPPALDNSTKSNRVAIYKNDIKNLTDFPNTVAARTRILIDGKDERDVRFYEYIIDFQGDRPVRTTDFETPIRGTVPPDRKIIAVQQSLADKITSEPTRRDKAGHLLLRAGPQIHCDIYTTDQRNFEITPMLMNPDDWFRVEVYTSAATIASEKEPKSAKATGVSTTDVGAVSPEITWSCRIAGVACPSERELSFSLPIDLSDSDSHDPLDASINEYQGWPVYFIVLFTIGNLIIMVVLAKRTLHRVGPVGQLALLAVAVFLSMATAEILADWWFHDHSVTAQPAAARVILTMNCLCFIFLAVNAARPRRKLKTEVGQPSAENVDTPPDDSDTRPS